MVGTQERQHRRRGQDGLTLMEMLVSMAILGVIGVGFMSGMTTAFRARDISRERVTAENLARNQLEYIRYVAYDALDYGAEVPPPSITVPAGYSITVTTTDYCDGTGEPGFEPCYDPANIQKNTVKVSRDGRTLVTVEDLKTRR